MGSASKPEAAATESRDEAFLCLPVRLLALALDPGMGMGRRRGGGGEEEVEGELSLSLDDVGELCQVEGMNKWMQG